VAGAEMAFEAGKDAIYGTMRMLADKKDAAFELLRLAVNEPRFDEGPVDRIRAQIKSGILADSRDPEEQAEIAFSKAIYGAHPYSRRKEGTIETLDSITPDDLAAFHRKMFAKANLYVAVVGDIDAETLKSKLDLLFGRLPEKPDLRPIGKADLHLDQIVRVEYDLPQSTIRLAYPGVARDDPRFYAAYVMNHILGGGAFSSRLFEEVREKRGLAYGVGSSLITRKYADLLVIGTATRADATKETLGIIRDVVHTMAEDGVTAKELQDAKENIIGGYAINNLDSSSSIVRTLVDLQIENLGIDYIDRRESLINAVTREEVAQMARSLLGAKPAIMIVGPGKKEGEPT
jgi:zinc protease